MFSCSKSLCFPNPFCLGHSIEDQRPVLRANVYLCLTLGAVLEALSSSEVRPCWEGSGLQDPSKSPEIFLAKMSTCCMPA